jgi:predicted nucleic acid-binding protein
VAFPLIADTGGLLRAIARRPDGRAAWPAHARALGMASRVVVPAAVLVEVDYFLRANRPAMRQLVEELFDPTTTLAFEPATEDDVIRAMEIDRKFHELAIGLVDGVVAAVAERLRVYRILTIDNDDFGPLRVGHRFTQRLEIVP